MQKESQSLPTYEHAYVSVGYTYSVHLVSVLINQVKNNVISRISANIMHLE